MHNVSQVRPSYYRKRQTEKSGKHLLVMHVLNSYQLGNKVMGQYTLDLVILELLSLLSNKANTSDKFLNLFLKEHGNKTDFYIF